MKLTNKFLASALGIFCMIVASGCSTGMGTDGEETESSTQEAIVSSESVEALAEGKIRFWSDVNFGGDAEGATATGGCINFAGGPNNMNDRASSVDLISGQFRAFEHANCTGASLTITGDISNLHASGWGDRISSFAPF